MSQNRAQPTSRDAFDVAIICALRIESDAVEAIFDQFWDEEVEYVKARGDSNSYTLGRIGRHNVVLACMPGMGKVASATVAASFRASFPSIRPGLVVGICRGVPRHPDGGADIRLCDVIISTGVVQYDFGRQLPDQVLRKDTRRPNAELRGFLHKMQGWRGRTELSNRLVESMSEIYGKAGFTDWKHPGAEHDYLFPATYRHKHQTPGECMTCDKCADDRDAVCHDALSFDCEKLKCAMSQATIRGHNSSSPTGISSTITAQATEKLGLHFGLIASGDLVMKSATHRDQLAAREDVIGFEMEGAGAWDMFSTVVIKGVCDYADSHKNKKWQKYAAVTAAACTKAFLRQWRGIEKSGMPQGQAISREESTSQESELRRGIHQGGSQFHGPVTVSGGKVFHGNYIGMSMESDRTADYRKRSLGHVACAMRTVFPLPD